MRLLCFMAFAVLCHASQFILRVRRLCLFSTRGLLMCSSVSSLYRCADEDGQLLSQGPASNITFEDTVLSRRDVGELVLNGSLHARALSATGRAVWTRI